MTRIAIVYRRKREGKTDYVKRRKLLASKKLRLVIRKSLKNMLLQVIEYFPSGDRVLLTASSLELDKFGWKGSKCNLPAAYLCGYLLGTKAKQKKIAECVLDMGMQTSIKGNKIYAALKGVIDAGLKVPCSEEIFPDPKRVTGEHIAGYAKKIKQNKDKYEREFSRCVKNNFDPEQIGLHFNEIKSKIGAKK